MGGRDNQVIGIQKGTWYDEHWVLYTIDELLKTISETNDVLVNEFIFKILFIHERYTEAETQAEGEAGTSQGAQCGIWSRDQDHALSQRQTPNHWTTQVPIWI